MSIVTLEGEGHSISGCNFNVQHPQIDKYNIFVVLYATNQLTLCQAVNAMYNAIVRETGSQMNIKDLFEHFGHRLCEEDNIQIDEGFDGNIQAWFEAGNMPVGWYQLFKDNYEQYKEKTNEPV